MAQSSSNDSGVADVNPSKILGGMPPPVYSPSFALEEQKIEEPESRVPRQVTQSHPPDRIDTPSTMSIEPERKTIRKRDFGFIPIPKSRRYDPSMKPEECFPWSMRMNLVFASAAVRLAAGSQPVDRAKIRRPRLS